MSDLEYDDVGDVDGKPVLLCAGRVVADFDKLLDAYESKCGDHRATLRLYTSLVKAHEELKAELSALRNSVRQQSVRATEQQLREVTAERDRLRERLGAMEVAANTVGYCYRNNPANFAVALNALEDIALSVREAIDEAMTHGDQRQ